MSVSDTSAKGRALFKWVVIVIILALVLGLGGRFLMTALGQKGGGKQRPPTVVAAASVVMRSFPDTVGVLGTLEGGETAPLSAPGTQRIVGVHVQSGQRVTRGQALISLSAAEEQGDTAAASAALLAAEQALARTVRLVDSGIVAPARLDADRATRDAAAARVRAAQSRGADRVIRAPFDGVVGLVTLSPGALARPGDVLLMVDQVQRLRIDLMVPERDLAILRDGAPVTGRVEAWPDRVFTGVLRDVSSRVDPATGLIAARAYFDNADGALRPGMVMQAELTRGVTQALSVPEEALQYEGDRTFVYVIVKDDAGLKLERREVTISTRYADQAAVVAGVRRGERVVAAGLNRIRPGDAVRIEGEASKPKSAEQGRAP